MTLFWCVVASGVAASVLFGLDKPAYHDLVVEYLENNFGSRPLNHSALFVMRNPSIGVLVFFVVSFLLVGVVNSLRVYAGKIGIGKLNTLESGLASTKSDKADQGDVSASTIDTIDKKAKTSLGSAFTSAVKAGQYLPISMLNSGSAALRWLLVQAMISNNGEEFSYSTYRCKDRQDRCGLEVALTQFDPVPSRNRKCASASTSACESKQKNGQIQGEEEGEGGEEELILVYLHGGAFTLDDAGDILAAERLLPALWEQYHHNHQEAGNGGKEGKEGRNRNRNRRNVVRISMHAVLYDCSVASGGHEHEEGTRDRLLRTVREAYDEIAGNAKAHNDLIKRNRADTDSNDSGRWQTVVGILGDSAGGHLAYELGKSLSSPVTTTAGGNIDNKNMDNNGGSNGGQVTHITRTHVHVPAVCLISPWFDPSEVYSPSGHFSYSQRFGRTFENDNSPLSLEYADFLNTDWIARSRAQFYGTLGGLSSLNMGQKSGQTPNSRNQNDSEKGEGEEDSDDRGPGPPPPKKGERQRRQQQSELGDKESNSNSEDLSKWLASVGGERGIKSAGGGISSSAGGGLFGSGIDITGATVDSTLNLDQYDVDGLEGVEGVDTGNDGEASIDNSDEGIGYVGTASAEGGSCSGTDDAAKVETGATGTVKSTGSEAAGSDAAEAPKKAVAVLPVDPKEKEALQALAPRMLVIAGEKELLYSQICRFVNMINSCVTSTPFKTLTSSLDSSVSEATTTTTTTTGTQVRLLVGEGELHVYPLWWQHPTRRMLRSAGAGWIWDVWTRISGGIGGGGRGESDERGGKGVRIDCELADKAMEEMARFMFSLDEGDKD